jgi:hypothetical protein
LLLQNFNRVITIQISEISFHNTFLELIFCLKQQYSKLNELLKSYSIE